MAHKIGLGKGLSALIPGKNILEKKSPPSPSSSALIEMLISEIKPNPHQPRKDLNPQKLLELASSIKEHGILQPLIVDQEGRLIVGQRRLEAAKLAGLSRVPVIMREGDEEEKLEMSIVENVQRQDLNPIEKAEGYQLLITKFGLTQEEVGGRVGKKRSTVTNYLRFLNLSSEIQQGLREGKIGEGQAKEILSIPDPEKQIFLYKRTIQGKLSTGELRKLIKRFVLVRKHLRKRRAQNPFLAQAEEKLQEILSTRVKVSRDGRVGQILIEFYSDEELGGILEKIVK